MRVKIFLIKNVSFISVLTLSILFLFGCIADSENKELPNILWLVSEDNSPYLGCYGDDFAETPNLDNLASEGVLYTNAYANAPVCAPARFTIITSCFPTSMGTQHMRSKNPVPDNIKFFTQYLREKGYYCTNCAKEDYNTPKPDGAWDESGRQATYRNRAEGQPFFHVQNFGVSHESSIHKWIDSLKHNPDNVILPPYHPDTPEIRHDWAQYYDKISELDKQIGNFLQNLKNEGLTDNTIIMYYSDHGGVLARSKRYLYETGTRVPLIIRFPEKFSHTASGKPSSQSKQLVSFVDLAPTMLSLAGIPVPEYMQGVAFLGNQAKLKNEYVYMFRGRMDEKYDMSRAVRDEQYRYIRNYMPYRIYGQHLEYLWRAPSVPSWEKAYINGDCNKEQSIFWEPKEAEELYDVNADPWEVNNLINNPECKPVLKRMRDVCDKWILATFDSGFMPEAEWNERISGMTISEYLRTKDYPLAGILEVANTAIENKSENLPFLVDKLKDTNSAVRYWAATGLFILGEHAKPAIPQLKEALRDPSGNVRIITAETLCNHGYIEEGISILKEELNNPNDLTKLYALNAIDCIKGSEKICKKKVTELLNGKSPDDRTYYLRAARALLKKWEL